MPKHYSILTAALGVALAGCADSEVTQYSIEQFLETTSYRGASFSPGNDKLLVSHNASGIYNAFALPVDGGSPEQLTNSSDESIFVIGYFPEDERFLYSADQGGNELNHVYVRELDGTVTDLTPGDNLRAQFYGWAYDRTSFFIGTSERDPRFFDIYEYQIDGYDRSSLFQDNEGFGAVVISPDRNKLALGKVVSGSDSDILIHDRSTGRTELLTDDAEPAQNTPMTFSPDGESLYYLTDRGSEFQHLVREHLETGEGAPIQQPEWDVMYASLSHGGNYLTVGINNDARTELRLLDAGTLEAVPMPEIPNGDVTSVRISDDETKMAFYARSARMPSDLFVADVGGTEARQLTSSLNPSIDGDDLVDAVVVRFASYDGVEIPGILYKPHLASASNPVPALVWVHGGPGGQSRVGYSGLIQYLVNHGYVVYAINNRGSSGYGKTFFHMDDRVHGDKDLDDVVHSKQMLIETGYVDPDRIGIIGGSYGGYMVLAALTFRPLEFDVGVDLYGISNWHRTVTNIPPWWESFRVALEEEMGDFDDEEFFKAKSPLFHATNIVRPLMVLQGANDPRVLKVESDEIVEAVRANGVPVEYVVFDDEGHGFVKKENQEEAYRRILQFLDEHLRTATEQ